MTNFEDFFSCLTRVLDNLPDDQDIMKDLIQMIFHLKTMKNKKEERPVKVPWKYFPIWKYPHLIASLTSGLNEASNSPPAENKLHRNFLNLIYT